MKNQKNIEILTPNGFQKFDGIRKIKKHEYLKLYLSNDSEVVCSLNHVWIVNGNEKVAHSLEIFDQLDTSNGEVIVINDITYHKTDVDLYDVIGVGNGNLFITDNNLITHNCDVSFVSSGETVVDSEILTFYKETFVQEPLEKTGFDGNLWKWEYPDYTKQYIVSADVARGDGKDYSACHVIEVSSMVQVAEYRGKIGTKEYGNFLVALATEYNNALLVVENANIGWAVIQQIIDREYSNLFYMSSDLKYVDTLRQMTNKYYSQEKNMKPGFSTTSKTRPLIISKLEMNIRENTLIIRSSRTLDELFVFVYINNRPEAMKGYNDDLVMSLAIGLWVRDTSLRLINEQLDLTQSSLNAITQHSSTAVFGGNSVHSDNPWSMDVNGRDEDISWLVK